MNRRAFTLPELLIAMAVASALMLAGYGLMQMSYQVYHKVSGNEDVTMQLKRGSRLLQQHLIVSNFDKSKVQDCPASLPGGAPDGTALCVLSALDNGVGDMATKPGGEPYWQRNVLFYITVPTGDPCAGGAGPLGYDDRCPHKVLIRKIIDSGPATAPTGNPGADIEDLLSDLSPYLTRPNKLDTSAMLGEPGVTRVDILATHLLGMYAEREPNPDAPGEIMVTLSAFNVEASKGVAVGTASLSGHENLVAQILSVFPRNNQ